MFQGGVKARPRIRWVRTPLLPPALSSYPSSATHMTCAPRLPLLFFHYTVFFSFFFWIICHLSGPTTVCLSLSLSVGLLIFLLFYVCLSGSWPRAIESNYNICEEGSSNHANRPGQHNRRDGYVMAKRKALKNQWENLCENCENAPTLTNNIYAFSSDRYQVDQLKTEIHIARLISCNDKLRLKYTVTDEKC